MDKQKSKLSILSQPNQERSTSRNKSIIQKQANVLPDTSDNVSAMDQNRNNQPPTTRTHIMDSFIIIWLDSKVKDLEEEKHNLSIQFRPIISTIQLFNDPDECVDFLTDVRDEKVFVITHNYPYHSLLPLMDEIPQLHSIYILNTHQAQDEQCIKQCKKVKGVFDQIEHIYDTLKEHTHQLMRDLTSVSIISPSTSLSLDELDQSFMYTQLLKEIIIEIQYDGEKAKEEFCEFCFKRSAEQDFQLKTIKQFQQCYELHPSIWWYTKEWFVYSVLNKALRVQDVELIMKMGFFVQDLHREIEQRYLETPPTTKITVYRGQGLSNTNFEKLKKSKGGLISFNHFLSTSIDRPVSLMFADSARQNADLVGILFQMEVDPSIPSSPPFALINNIGNFDDEAEVLFSMHTVFRIGDMNQIDDRLWEVNLTLTSDNDQQLKCLTDYIRNEIGSAKEWHRMGMLMIKMGKFEKALEIYDTLLETITADGGETVDIARDSLGHCIGQAFYFKGDYSAALLNYEKCLKIIQEHFPPNHPLLADLYNNIGLTHYSMRDLPKALLNHNKALKIQQQCLPSNNIRLASTYSDIALIHYSMHELPRALENLEKAIEIQQKSGPSHHPDLAINYASIAAVHHSLGDYSLACQYSEKALEIQTKYLPPNHPNFAVTYNNIGVMYQSLGNYSIARSYYEKTLEIQQKSLPQNHPNFAATYNNIGAMHQSLGNYSIARSYYEKTLEIQEKYLPPNHSDLIMTHTHIASVNQLNQDFLPAISNYEKILEIQRRALSIKPPSSAAACSNANAANERMEDYSRMFSDLKKVLEIQQKLCPSGESTYVLTDENIDELTDKSFNMISNVEKVLKLQKQSLPENLPSLRSAQSTTEDNNQMMDTCLTMISHFKKAFKIQPNCSSFDDQEATDSTDNNDEEPFSMSHISAAMTSYQKALEIQQKYNPPNDVSLSTNYSNIGNTYYSGGDYINALSFFEKALENLRQCHPINQQLLAKTYNNIAMALEGLRRYKEAIDYARQAVDAARSALGPDHPETKAYQNHLNQVRQKR